MLGILCFFNIFRSSLLMEIFHWLNVSFDFRKLLSFLLSPHHPTPFYLSSLHKVAFISHAQDFLYLLGFLFLSDLISWLDQILHQNFNQHILFKQKDIWSKNTLCY